MEELKPCPFCGGAVTMQYTGSSDWEVECKTCPVETKFWVSARKHGYGEGEHAEAIRRWNARTAPEAAEMAETLKRLRSQIPGCDCDNPAQCWESCGTLGHSEEHMKVIKDSNKP